MTMVDGIFLDTIHVLVPFLIYLFYIAYNKSFNDKENELIVLITIFSALYIILKYNFPIFDGIPMFLVSLPLLISCFKKNDIAVFMSSIVAAFYYFMFYDGYVFLIIFQFILYFVVYKVLFNKLKPWQFITIFTIILSSFILIITSLIYYKQGLFNYYFEILLISLIFLIVAILIIYLLNKIEDILNTRVTAKEIEHDKQIKNTLFQITHEIKNPIAVCKGYLDMFDVENPKHAQKYIPIMKDEIEKTLFLLEDFLSMNKVKINKDLLDINYLLSNFIKTYEPYFKENKIDTNIKITDHEVYLNGDYNRLFQVLTNVMKNSIEALGENPHIDVWTQIKKNKFYIYIKDNGEGIPRDILEKIREPFFTTKMNGTGLGVSLSSEIIESHEGKLLYESEMGEYTLVTIILPILEWD
ncbi:MAG: HAMP domain-containing histidine kinase [Bacilli bacterium]|nr:HAMP domain-containing histidine kinase [Bacilli bacterium]